MGPLPVLILLLVGGTDSPPVPDNTPDNPGVTPADSSDPITGIGRLNWAVKSTIGPASLWTGVITSTWGTVFDKPREYGESFDGFAKRYGLRLTGVGTSNVMEAGLGAIWGEDPRYHRSEGTFRSRIGHAVKTTVLAENRDGRLEPAYARYIAISGGNVLSNTWRPDSQRTVGNTMERIGYGFGGRLMGNLWDEFWPSVKNHMFWNKH
jgi:hypothetical protein